MYHTGIEVLGSEYTFAYQAGVFHHTPKEIPQATFREQLYMGDFDGGHTELKLVVDAIGADQFGPNDYHILNRNCNHFANTLCTKLTRTPTPAYINRLADIGSCLSCLIPKQFLQSSPVDRQAENESQSFLMKVPMNRGGPVQLPLGTTVFSGVGTVLGGNKNTGSSISSSHTNRGNSSNKNAAINTQTDSLTDRRDKARTAALARLEIQQQHSNSGSDKSM
jgi:deubiquitinase DESI2